MQRQCILFHLIRGFLIGKLPRELIKPNALNNYCLRDTVILLSRNILRWFTGTWPCPIFNLNVSSFLLGELLTFVWVMMLFGSVCTNNLSQCLISIETIFSRPGEQSVLTVAAVAGQQAGLLPWTETLLSLPRGVSGCGLLVVMWWSCLSFAYAEHKHVLALDTCSWFVLLLV